MEIGSAQQDANPRLLVQQDGVLVFPGGRETTQLGPGALPGLPRVPGQREPAPSVHLRRRRGEAEEAPVFLPDPRGDRPSAGAGARLRAFQALAPSIGGRPALIVFVDITRTSTRPSRRPPSGACSTASTTTTRPPGRRTTPPRSTTRCGSSASRASPGSSTGTAPPTGSGSAEQAGNVPGHARPTPTSTASWGTLPGQRRIRRDIRQAVRRYDLVDVSPDFTIYGDPVGREWKQYWLTDDNGPAPPPRRLGPRRPSPSRRQHGEAPGRPGVGDGEAAVSPGARRSPCRR